MIKPNKSMETVKLIDHRNNQSNQKSAFPKVSRTCELLIMFIDWMEKTSSVNLSTEHSYVHLLCTCCVPD